MTAPLSDHDRFVLSEARRIGPILRAVDGDAERHAGWLLAELVTIVERLDGGTGQDGGEEGTGHA